MNKLIKEWVGEWLWKNNSYDGSIIPPIRRLIDEVVEAALDDDELVQKVREHK